MKKISVLIVDDHREWCALLGISIESAHPLFQVLEPVYNGEAALACIRDYRPDVIMLDLVIPVYDGLFLIDSIQQMEDYNPFIYVLSAIGTERTNAVMQKVNIGYYSVKPINPKNVANNLVRFLIDANLAHSPSPEPAGGWSQKDIAETVGEYFSRLGAPPYLKASARTQTALCISLRHEHALDNIMEFYELVAREDAGTATSVERNIRSTVKQIIRMDSELLHQLFPYADKRLTNAEFLHASKNYLLQRMGERFNDPVSIGTHRELYCDP